MARKLLTELSAEVYEHPFDRKALISLQKMPGVSLLFTKINEFGIDRLLRFKFTGIGMRVNSRNFPEMYRAFEEACNILDVSPPPELSLLHGTGYIRTLTIGTTKPIVIINVDGMEQLSYDELLFAFGHELGHIKSKHLLYHQMAMILPGLGQTIANSTLGLGGLASQGIELALYQWVIMAKFTSDRAGLLACQDIDVANTALIKLAGLSSQHINPTVMEEFIAGAREFGSYDLDHLDKLTKILSFMEPMHPWTTMRASELLKWVDSGEYEALMEGSKIAEEPEEAGEWDFLTSWQ